MKINALMIVLTIFTFIIVPACVYNNKSKSTNTSSQHTTVSSHLEDKIDSTHNMLYCASFQIAWNAMRDQIINGDIILEPDTHLAKYLNHNLLRKKDISPESYVATAGELSQNFVARINKELKEKFGEQAADVFNSSPSTSNSHRLVVYAFLYKKLEFPAEFEKLDTPINFVVNGREAPVAAFGINSFSSAKQFHNKLSNQVTIIDYINEDNFILMLDSKCTDDQIIIAKIAHDINLLKTYESVVNRMLKVKNTRLKDNETLRIPKIDFDISHSFSELENKQIMNKGWEGWSIAKASQNVRFKFDEKGAVLKSRAFMALMDAPPPKIEKPRKFIFDKPFLIFLKQKNGDYPYFALWVSNPKLFIAK